jgi:hypothetical protein
MAVVLMPAAKLQINFKGFNVSFIRLSGGTELDHNITSTFTKISSNVPTYPIIS